MRNPYEILGIPATADEPRLREAYRCLARKYAGDSCRMQELNDAYDSIVLARGGSRGEGPRAGAGGGSAGLEDIRKRIQAGRFDDALTLLDGVPRSRRCAEWHYLKGRAQEGRGWLEEAGRNYAQAARMDSASPEYRAAWERMSRGRQGFYRDAGADARMRSLCLGASSLMCAKFCCDCLR
ncbi:MAG: J domain-containing protein [Oscillospiraceae bacterium]|nr:J domain-containing protein [Oscillospiraceae bacterium]